MTSGTYDLIVTKYALTKTGVFIAKPGQWRYLTDNGFDGGGSITDHTQVHVNVPGKLNGYLDHHEFAGTKEEAFEQIERMRRNALSKLEKKKNHLNSLDANKILAKAIKDRQIDSLLASLPLEPGQLEKELKMI